MDHVLVFSGMLIGHYSYHFRITNLEDQVLSCRVPLISHQHTKAGHVT